MLKLDHIAVACEDLRAGAEMVEDLLGVPLQRGGQHALFGTHNMLMGMQDGLYLEVIAVDPTAPAPLRARWFDLDNFSGAPRLTNWICRTDDLKLARRKLPEAGLPVAISRGDLSWRMAVPEDGKLPYDNCYPALIEWLGEAHPVQKLAPQPVRLVELRVFHPDAEELGAEVGPLLGAAPVVFLRRDRAGLEAEFETPKGRRVLR